MSPPDAFRAAIVDAGLTAPETLIFDGKLHRFASNGDRTDDSGWYVLHGDGIPAGSFGCWRSSVNEKWCAKTDRQLTEQERADNRRRIEEARRLRDQDEGRRQTEAAKRAVALWEGASPAPVDHPYLLRKQVRTYDLRVTAERHLIVPIRTGCAMTSLQFIDVDGNKKFLPGGQVKACYWEIGEVPTNKTTTLVIVEGVATGASVHEATGLTVIIAFSAGNLLAVAEYWRELLPKATMIIAGDHDISGVGQDKAKEAAKAVKGIYVIPNEAPNDWNDIHVRRGLPVVRTAIMKVLPSYVADEVDIFLRRFVSYPSEHDRVAHTLWILHTHLMEAWESTPRLAFLSPEPGSGKTRALEVTETLVPRPVESVNATAAYLFRKVSDPDGRPTILYDEIDTLFGAKATEHEEIRGLINAGHRRGASAGRCVLKGRTIMTEELPAFCAVAMAGLGNLPDTILSRSVIIRMRRRTPGEEVESYRRRIHAPEGHRLRDRLIKWAEQIEGTLDTNPMMPEGITDRAADVWESLISVADALGFGWPARARVAAVAHVALARTGTPSLGVRLLADLRVVFCDHDILSTEQLISSLTLIEESPWNDLRGKPLDARRLANLLRPYGVTSKVVRIGTSTPRGYTKDDLFDAWTRYLPVEDEVNGAGVPRIGSATSATSATPEQNEIKFDEEAPC